MIDLVTLGILKKYLSQGAKPGATFIVLLVDFFKKIYYNIYRK